jgi:hypothetical protein
MLKCKQCENKLTGFDRFILGKYTDICVNCAEYDSREAILRGQRKPDRKRKPNYK